MIFYDNYLKALVIYLNLQNSLGISAMLKRTNWESDMNYRKLSYILLLGFWVVMFPPIVFLNPPIPKILSIISHYFKKNCK